MKRISLIILAIFLVLSSVAISCSTSAPPSAPAPVPVPTSTTAPLPTSSPTASSVSKPTGSATAAQSSVIKLRYADQNTLTGWQGVHATKPWIDQIEAATNGRVKIDPYYSQSLCKGVDAWEATKNGVADIAWCFHGYWANLTPLTDIVSLPFLPFTSAEQASGILWQLYEKYPSINKEFKDNKVLLLFGSTPYIAINSKKEIKTLEDFKGLKMRMTAGPAMDMIKSIGGTPVVTPMPDTYLNLQKGVIDGTISPWEAIYTNRLYEVTKYYTTAPIYIGYFSQSMNLSTWNNLPPDIQKQIESVCGITGSKFWGKNMFDSVGLETPKYAKLQGFPLVEYNLPQDELNRWTKQAESNWESWVKNKEKGYPETREILNSTVNLIKTYKP